jgi:hypothetical protein
MKRQGLAKAIVLFVCMVLLLGCGGSGNNGATTGATPPNALTVTINPASAVCDGVNELCTNVIVCQPNTSSCQTISDVLVDTGSYGLRLFSSALSVSLAPQTSGGSPIGECVFFGSLTTWGSVQLADLRLGGEPLVQVPVQVINPVFAGQYTSTGQPVSNVCGVGQVEANPSQAGFNGILGVGVLRFDDQFYYSCTSTTCVPVSVPPSQQVQNPVALFPVDNNGVVISLPSVPAGGAPSISGLLTFGIGTQSNNQPSGVTVYPVDACGQFITIYKGTTFNDGGNCAKGGGFLDTGSNAYFFPDTIPLCSSASFFCPPTTLNLSAVTTGATGAPSNTVGFQIATGSTLFASGNAVFNNLGGPTSGVFDWGLPFFLGRTVYMGIQGQSSSLGPGPYWAY